MLFCTDFMECNGTIFVVLKPKSYFESHKSEQGKYKIKILILWQTKSVSSHSNHEKDAFKCCPNFTGLYENVILCNFDFSNKYDVSWKKWSILITSTTEQTS